MTHSLPRAPQAEEATDRRLDHERLPQHLDRLLRTAMVITGSREDAEDLVQETYVRVMRRPRLVRRDNDLAYLMRTMRNTWSNIRRGRGAEARAVAQREHARPRSRPRTIVLA